MSTRSSLVRMADLTAGDVGRILDTADRFASVMDRDIKKVPTLRGRTVVNLFLEPSTRTSTSFELAAKRLSADVVSIKGQGTSMDKGETLKDTILTLEAYEPDVFVIRHPQVGACAMAGRYTDAAVVNAGDGTGEHPTQALLDVFTVQQEVGSLDGMHVAIVGDVLHSRVGIQAFRMMGARVTVVAPPTLVPRHLAEALGVEVSADIRDIADADIVYVLRMQVERMGAGGFVPSLEEYARMYQVNHARLGPGQRVMHAGPVNRGVEISGEVVDDPGSLIEAQAANGLVVRMAVLYDVLTEAAGEPGEDEGGVLLEAA